VSFEKEIGHPDAEKDAASLEAIKARSGNGGKMPASSGISALVKKFFSR
jgi:hypothetical protein